MSRREVMGALSAAGLPTCYREWAPASPPDMPYLVFYRVRRNDVHADNGNYLMRESWCAELYSRSRDERAEAAVEAALSAAGISYTTTEAAGDHFTLAAYHFETIGGS